MNKKDKINLIMDIICLVVYLVVEIGRAHV